ncbi:hypothetical protein AURANDRAFT_69055, partial [Aureococcus anophagefferens]
AYEAEAARRVAAGKVYRVDERDADETKTCVNNLKVDKMHFKNHTGAYCRANCNPKLKNFKDSVKYMKPGNFIFILYLLCEFRNNMKIATAAYKKARANKKRTRAADSESSDSESDY